VIGEVLGQRRKSGPQVILADTRLETLALDSLDVAEVFLAIEDRVGYRLDPDSVGDPECVGDLTRLRPL